MKMQFSVAVVLVLAGMGLSACGGKFDLRTLGHKSAGEEDASPNLIPDPAPPKPESQVPEPSEGPVNEGDSTTLTVTSNKAAVVDLTEPAPVPVIPAPAASAPHPDPVLVTILSAQFAGTACLGGTGGLAEFSADLAELKVTWPNEIASEVGPGVSLQRSRRQCSLSLVVTVPEGWVYRTKTIAVTAISTLDLGVTATAVSQVYFQGSAITAEFSSDRVGPLDLSDAIAGDLLSEWSPLNLQRAMNLKQDSRQTVDSTVNPSGRGIHAVQPAAVYALEWENRLP